jgi:Zn-dependent M28 family amino/carboxypeptidase
MLLESARQVSKLESRPRRSIAFVAFDLEEHLLWGSRWFAAHAPWELVQVKLFITADMIGRSLGNLPLPTVFVLGSEHGTRLREMLGDVGTPQGLEVARLGIDLIGTRSDYGPFRDEKVPFLFFSTGEHPDYHTPRDTADRIDYDKAARVSNLILAVARHAADVDQPPTWVAQPETDIGEAETVHRITQLLLDSDQSGEIKLGGVQKFFVSQVNLQMQAILERGVLTKEERETLAKAAQTLLLSVF